MLYQLPPVGNPISLSRQAAGQADFADLVAPWSYRFYQSGTAALASTLLVARRRKPVAEPEVILPAYACPDLVSAAVYAGVKPVLVDFTENRPWMDFTALEQCISENTVAIVAVNFLGIQERIELLGRLARQAGVLLIEDSAQAFPVLQPAGQGSDLVILSFGRGKPVSLLGGGALLYQNSEYAEFLPELGPADSTLSESLAFRLKAAIYNAMISPWVYWLPASLPFLHLGETRFHPLPGIDAITTDRLQIMSSNLKAYASNCQTAQIRLRNAYDDFNQPSSCMTSLPVACETHVERPLLRYPFLVGGQKRDRLVDGICRRGLGASRMYPAILPDIDGVGGYINGPGEYPRARSFAEQLITLPMHNRVRQKDIGAMQEVIRKTLI